MKIDDKQRKLWKMILAYRDSGGDMHSPFVDNFLRSQGLTEEELDKPDIIDIMLHKARLI